MDAGDVEVQDRAVAVAELRALIRGGHESGAPHAAAAGRFLVVIQQHDERGQILVLGPQAVSRPRPPGWAGRRGCCRCSFGKRCRRDSARRPSTNGSRQCRRYIRRRADTSRKPESRSRRTASTSACVASSGLSETPIGVITRLIGIGQAARPAYSLTFGLGSNVSRWLGPPSMNRKMQLFAWVKKCGACAANGSTTIFSAADKPSCCNKPCSANAPNPPPARAQKFAARP